jgi:hypothetical protein
MPRHVLVFNSPVRSCCGLPAGSCPCHATANRRGSDRDSFADDEDEDDSDLDSELEANQYQMQGPLPAGLTTRR